MKPTRTQAEYIGNVNEIQRLRKELAAVRAELSNARVARDQALAECAELRSQLEADEKQVAEELARLKVPNYSRGTPGIDLDFDDLDDRHDP